MTVKMPIFYQHQRKTNTLSNLIDQFDENYDGGIGLKDSIIDLIETRNVDTPDARKISDDAIFSVAERALIASASLPTDVQHFNVIREVTNFLTLASDGPVSESVNKHTDLLPVQHPNSTATHEFSITELRQLRAGWVSADPRILNDDARAIVAAVYGSNPNSLDYHYNMIRLNSLGDQIPSDLRIMPILAFGDPYAGKNSFWHRKMRAEGQRRDDEGQFAEMGGGARLYVKMPMGNIISVVGKIAGIPEHDPKGIDLEITDVPGITPGIYTVPSDMTHFFKAILPGEAVKKSSPVGPGLNVNYVDIADMVRKDLPTSWYPTDSGSTVPSLNDFVKADGYYATGDGYRVSKYNDLTEALQGRVSEATDKFGATVLNTNGTDLLEKGKPVYELISTKRGQEEVVGFAQDWAGIQQLTKTEDTNYPDSENEPIQEENEPEPRQPKPTAPVETTPEEPQEVTPEVTEEDNPEDSTTLPLFDPMATLPGDWRETDQGSTFISSDGRYSAQFGDTAVGTALTSTFDLNSGDKFDGEAPVSLQALNIYANGSGNFIGTAFDWDSAKDYIQSYEHDEELSVVDRMSDKRYEKEPVQVDELDPKRYELLEPVNDQVKADVEKNKGFKRYVDIWDKPVGAAGVDEGIVDASLNQALWHPINNLLQQRDVDSRAVDMVDEMRDYPQNFTTAQLVTLYYNLKQYPNYEGPYNRKNAFGYAQDRQKMRMTLNDLEKYKLNDTDYVKGLQDKIDNYRFIGHYALQELRRNLNEYINNNAVRKGEEYGKEAVIFKDKMKVTGKDLLKTDAILDSDGTILEISSISEDEEDPNSLDVYVKRGDKDAYYPLKKDDTVTVFRGSGVLPTPENLKRAEDVKKGRKSTPVAQGEILDGNGEGSADSRITAGKKDPADVKFPIKDSFVKLLETFRNTHSIDDKADFDRLDEIIRNPQNYEYKAAQDAFNAVKSKAEKRQPGEYTADPELRDLITLMLNDRDVNPDQKQQIAKNLHRMSKVEATQVRDFLKTLRKAPGSTESGTDNLPDISAIGIAVQHGQTDVREEDYAPFGTDLVGNEAPSKSMMAKVKQLIDNYEIDADNPATLQFFMENHRALPKKYWKDLIERWEKPEFAKDRPTLLTRALPHAQGGPTNRQLASIERSIMKGILPSSFTGFIMSTYDDKPRAWFAKILDAVKEIENVHDEEVLNFAMRNLRDLSNLRVPPGYKVPDSYEPLEENIGSDLSPEEKQRYQNRFINAFEPYIRRKYGNDPFWTALYDSIFSPAEEPKDDSIDTPEEQAAKTAARVARLKDARRLRRRMARIAGNLNDMLGLSGRELSADGKRFVQKAISDLIYLRGAMDQRRKNVIQEPAELDRRLKLIATALANKPSAASYGNLKNANESTLNNLEDAASMVANLVGSYAAGQNEDMSAIDKMIDISAPTPRMKRFTPPAFSGPALKPLENLSEWEEVKDFIAKLTLYVFDFETTGIFDINDPDIKNDPIQLAIAKAYNFMVESSYNSYINPGSKLSQFTLQTIGDGTGRKVSRSFLEGQKSKLDAMKDFLDTVPEGAVLVGHNGLLFDIEVLNRTLREAGLPEYNFGGFIDTFGLSNHLMPRWSPENPDAPFRLSDYPSQGRYGVQVASDSLEALVTYFGLSNNGRHEADADVVSTLEVLERILDFAIAGRSERGTSFDFHGSNNGWSEEEYNQALEDYRKQSAEYAASRTMFNYALVIDNLITQQKDKQDQSNTSNEVLDKLIEMAKQQVVGVDDDRTGDMPSSRIVSELGGGSYVIDTTTGRVGRSYGSTGDGKVLVEFNAPDHAVSGRTTLEKLVPSVLYNATEALVTKDGMVLDQGMTVTHPSLGSGSSGVFSGFDGVNLGIIKTGSSIHRVPVDEIKVLPYTGTLPATKEQMDKVLDLIDELSSSKAFSRTIINALKKTVSSKSYPRNSLNNLISMLVNAREQRSVVDANKDTPGALPISQGSASSANMSAVDRMRKNPLTAEDVKDVKLDLTLVKQYLPHVELTDENLNILKAVIADVKNRGKSLNKLRNDIRVNAYAGTGKTTMAEAIVYLYAQMYPDDHILYLVFGKENQEEADKRLGNAGNALAKTLHSVAMNVEANKGLRAKYNAIPKQTGNSEGLNPRYAPDRVADEFNIFTQWSQDIKDQYGIEIPATALVQLAYNGLENWTMSADRDIAPHHFKEFQELLHLGNPSWAPGARRYLDVSETEIAGFDPLSAKPGDLVGEDGVYLGRRYVRKDSDGRIINVTDSLYFKNGKEIEDASKYSINLIIEFPEDSTRNEGFFIDQLIPIAQSFWDDIVSPLDPTRPQLTIDQQFIVKNWSLGNVDLTATTLDKSGKAVSALKLKDIPKTIILDEAQDINPVFVDIMKRQSKQYDNGIQIITVGDVYQNIFGFSGSINALDEIPYDGTFPLTYNRRSVEDILVPANDMLGVLGAPDRLQSAVDGEGNIVEPNTLVVDNMMLISRTNAGILDAALELEQEHVYDGKTFAVTPQFKKRMLAHLKTLDYLYWHSVWTKKLEKLNARQTQLNEENGETEDIELRDQILQAKEQLKKLKHPGADRPGVLIGATWDGIQTAIANGTADADTMIINTLLNKMKDRNDLDAEGKPRPMQKGKAFRSLMDRVGAYRTRNDSYEMPEIVGKAGALGNGIAYLVKGNQLVLVDGGPREYTSDDAGVFDNRKILESIGFTRTEELSEKTGLPKYEWVRPLRNPDDENYVKSELQSVYNALSGEDAAVLFLTGHTAKGLERDSVRLWKDWNPEYNGSDPDNQRKPAKLAGESDEDYNKRLEKERQAKIDKVMNRQEFNLFYVALTRAKRVLDMGGLAAILNRSGMLDTMKQALHAEDNPDDISPVDKMVSTPSEDYYSKMNNADIERKMSYIKSLKLSLKTPQMQRITPFQYATDADINNTIKDTRREISDIYSNPHGRRSRDENSRAGILEILAMIESGDGIASLSDEDRNRLYAYLGVSSLGSSTALEVDPTGKLKEAVAELNKRLGIE